MNKTPYRYTEHTADIGIEFWGSSLEDALAHAGMGFSNLITDLSKVETKIEFEFALPEEDPHFLLVHFLEEILYRFETKEEIFTEFEISRVPDLGYRIVGRGDVFDDAKHERRHEVKAITYHQASLEIEEDRWQGKVILDI